MFIVDTVVEQIKKLTLEAWMMIFTVLALIVGILAGLPLVVPNSRSSSLGTHAEIFIIAIVAQNLVFMIPKLRKLLRLKNNSIYLLKMLPLQLLFIFAYFNFKSWTPLVRDQLYDQQLYQLDQRMGSIMDAFVFVRVQVTELLGAGIVDTLYFTAFSLMFFLSFVAHNIFDNPLHQRQLAVALSLNMLIGGFGYWVLPSLGPFIFEQGMNQDAQQTQAIMLRMYGDFADGDRVVGYFGAALGAMPSMHIGHSLLFSAFAARSLKWLLVVYIPLFFWIFIECVVSKWHYIADIPGGILVAVMSLALTQKLVRQPSDAILFEHSKETARTTSRWQEGTSSSKQRKAL